jgi:hypothetical protein
MTTTTSTPTARLVELGQELGHHVANLAHSLRIMVHEVHTKGERPAQGHLTLTFPMKSRADGATVRDQFPGLVAELSRAADAMGTLHYCRLTALDDGTVLLLADFDGHLEAVLADLPKYLGPVLDPLLAHVSDPPPIPVADDPTAFVAWARARSVKAFTGYVTAPGVTAQKIKSAATRAGIELDADSATQLPLLVIMPMKNRFSVMAVSGALKVLRSYLTTGGDSVGTVHFAHLVALPGNHVGFFTIYNGPFDKYTQDFADKLGPAFDLMFKFTKDPPPTPTSKNAASFSQWVKDHDLTPLAFYCGYPGLQVQDVRALLADQQPAR